MSRKEKLLIRLKTITENLVYIQEEGILLSEESREQDSEIHNKIGQLEVENIALEKQLG